MASLYATIYYDKWIAVTGMKAISRNERRKLACALLDYACFGTEPEDLSNAALSMFNAIKTSLGARRHRGGQIGNTNAVKDKTNSETNTENECRKRISETNEENELVTSDAEHGQSLTKTETESEYVDSKKTHKESSSRSTQEKEKAKAKEKSGESRVPGVCPNCGKALFRHSDFSACSECKLIFTVSSDGSIHQDRIVSDEEISELHCSFKDQGAACNE